jgi:cyclophilin family peptidyl-prolyl cis-trans isomerase
MLLSRISVACALVAMTLTVAACGGDDESPTTSNSASTSKSILPPDCEDVQQPRPRAIKLKPPKEEVSPSESLAATVETSCGPFTIELDTKDSPKTVSSFVYMAKVGLYDDTTFHRIVPDFVIQGGDPTGTGTGGPGYSVDEPPPSRTEYTRGTVAMAKTQVEPPGRSGSQFFVVTAADAGLPPDYAVLGKVTSGEDVVQRISQLGDPKNPEGTPLAPVVIDKVTIG